MRTRIILVLAFFALMLACTISTAYLLLTTPYTSSVAGFFYKTENGHVVVTTVTPGQTGLRVGDEIIEFNRQRLTSTSQLRRFFVLASADTPFDVVVKRGRETQPLTLHTLSTTSPMRLGAVMGTFGYMSLEQLTGDTVDHRTDLFSIGVIAVEMLTGRRLFAARNYHEQLQAIMHQSFQLDDATAEAAGLDHLLQKCLAFKPEDRFETAAEARQQLVPAVHGSQLHSHDHAVSLDAETIINPN